MKRVILSEAHAERVAQRHRDQGATAKTFQYEQSRTRLTLFGIEVTTATDDGSRVETILFD